MIGFAWTSNPYVIKTMGELIKVSSSHVSRRVDIDVLENKNIGEKKGNIF